ncbi:MAG: serine/threonine-protein kinase [Planctomycetaceae bacterium]
MHPVRIGPYLIDRKIGAGGMGTVYVGKHEQSGQIAAIKTLPPSLARDNGFVLRFNREIEALKLLNHPNVVKFYDSGTDDEETYYYAMEYVEGETLSNRLRRDRRIPWKDAIQLAVQVCLGLKHAHDVGVVHRDLKPSNLLIASDGTVKITDFGVAQVFAADQLTITGAVIGTAEFMSPEQVEGRRADRRSDLYSLGAVLYTMLVGQPPFANGTPPEIMQKQRFGRFDPPRNYVPEIPSWLDDITCQLLEKSPEKRLPDAYVASRRLLEVIKKVELKNSAVPGSDAETRLDGPVAPGRLGATLVRDLVRAQSARNEPTSTFDRLMNNLWVLVGLLLLVLGGLIWFWPTIEDGSAEPSSEPERIIKTARWRWKTGDAVGATRQLEALRLLIAGDESKKQVVRSIDKLLSTIRNTRPTFKQKFVREAMDRARSQMATDPAKAKAILEGVLFLYENDRSLIDLISDVNKLLRQMENPDEPSDASEADDKPADALVPDSPNEKKSPAASESPQ